MRHPILSPVCWQFLIMMFILCWISMTPCLSLPHSLLIWLTYVPKYYVNFFWSIHILVSLLLLMVYRGDESIFWIYFGVKLQRNISLSVLLISIINKYVYAMIENGVNSAKMGKTRWNLWKWAKAWKSSVANYLGDLLNAHRDCLSMQQLRL